MRPRFLGNDQVCLDPLDDGDDPLAQPLIIGSCGGAGSGLNAERYSRNASWNRPAFSAARPAASGLNGRPPRVGEQRHNSGTEFVDADHDTRIGFEREENSGSPRSGWSSPTYTITRYACALASVADAPCFVDS